jgi:class 3 adenylate cyclase
MSKDFRYGACAGIDIVGFSQKPAYAQPSLIDDLEKIVSQSFQTFRNRVRATWIIGQDVVFAPSGDGLFVAFLLDNAADDNVIHCMNFAHYLCNILQRRLRHAQVRIGIATGLLQQRVAFSDVNRHTAVNVIGDAINLAVRVMDLASGGQVLATQGVYSHYVNCRAAGRGDAHLEFVRVGDYEIKHRHLLGVYAVYDPNGFRQIITPQKGRIDWATNDVALRSCVRSPQSLDPLLPLGAPDHGQRDPASIWPEGYRKENSHPYLVAEASVSCDRDRGRRVVTVSLSGSPRVAVDRDQRKRLETHPDGSGHPDALAFEAFRRGLRASLIGSVRHSAGGCIMLILCKSPEGEPTTYVAVIRKGARAPIHSMHLAAASGLAEHTDEWMNPYLTAVREAFEEISVLVPTGDPKRPLKFAKPVLFDDRRQTRPNEVAVSTRATYDIQNLTRKVLQIQLKNAALAPSEIEQLARCDEPYWPIADLAIGHSRTDFRNRARDDIHETLMARIRLWADGRVPEYRAGFVPQPVKTAGREYSGDFGVAAWLLPLFDFRAYPGRPAARKVMRAQARCSIAR